jgi:hypothetical protein
MRRQIGREAPEPALHELDRKDRCFHIPVLPSVREVSEIITSRGRAARTDTCQTWRSIVGGNYGW